jgi:hypothetical protein
VEKANSIGHTLSEITRSEQRLNFIEDRLNVLENNSMVNTALSPSGILRASALPASSAVQDPHSSPTLRSSQDVFGKGLIDLKIEQAILDFLAAQGVSEISQLPQELRARLAHDREEMHEYLVGQLGAYTDLSAPIKGYVRLVSDEDIAQMGRLIPRFLLDGSLAVNRTIPVSGTISQFVDIRSLRASIRGILFTEIILLDLPEHFFFGPDAHKALSWFSMSFNPNALLGLLVRFRINVSVDLVKKLHDLAQRLRPQISVDLLRRWSAMGIIHEVGEAIFEVLPPSLLGEVLKTIARTDGKGIITLRNIVRVLLERKTVNDPQSFKDFAKEVFADKLTLYLGVTMFSDLGESLTPGEERLFGRIFEYLEDKVTSGKRVFEFSTAS